MILFYGCTKKKTDTLQYSDEFKPIFNKTSTLADQNPAAALRYLDSAVNKTHDLNIADKFRYYAFHFVNSNRTDGDHQKALLYTDSMLAVIENAPNKRFYYSLYGEANFAKGDALFDLQRYSEAYNAYYKAYLIGKDNLSDCTLSGYTYRMGMITYKQAHFALAANYFKESFKRGECSSDFAAFFRQQEVLDNVGLSYRNAGLPDSALAYFKKAQAYVENHTSQFRDKAGSLDIARAVIYGNEADVLNLKGDYRGASDLLKKSIAINGKPGNDNRDAELSEVKLGRIYLAHNQDNELVTLLQSLRGRLDSVKNDEAEAGYNYLKGSYLRSKKDYAAAMVYMDQYYALRDSIAARMRVLKDNDLKDQLAGIEKQTLIEALLTKQRISIYVALVFASMAIVIILLIFRNWKRSKADLLVVSKLNQQVNEQKISLEHTLHNLEDSSQEKDRILRTVAHDLRNPLGGIASLANSMVEDAADYTDEQLELLKIIQETSYDSLELINEILEATNHISTELNKQAVDINSLLSNSVELLRFKAAEKNQRIALSLLPEAEELMISREKIWRVISNLISNAIKFSPTGGVIKVGAVIEDDHVILSVNDHGIGIPPALTDKVFHMFTDAKRPGTLGEKSFGLGLSICMQIIEKHGGKIWFESDKSSGTTFYVKLAREKTPAPQNVAGATY